MTWFQYQDAEFKYGLIKSVQPYETALGRSERKAPEWLLQSVGV